jgi:hypothetical protein
MRCSYKRGLFRIVRADYTHLYNYSVPNLRSPQVLRVRSREVAARNLINLCVGVLLAIPAFGLVVGLSLLAVGQPVAWGAFSIYAGLVALGLGLFEFGRRFAPVKLKTATKDTLTLSFTSEEYGRAFESANSTLIVSKLA